MSEMQSQVDRMAAEEIDVDGRTAVPAESARCVAVHIQGLLRKLNSLLHSYHGKVGTQTEQPQQSPAVQVTDLPGI